VLHAAAKRAVAAEDVSILTGPGGPVLPGPGDGRLPVHLRFNPHRARRPGATWREGRRR